MDHEDWAAALAVFGFLLLFYWGVFPFLGERRDND